MQNGFISDTSRRNASLDFYRNTRVSSIQFTISPLEVDKSWTPGFLSPPVRLSTQLICHKETGVKGGTAQIIQLSI